MRRLIINADDFGLTSGVNRAVVEAHQRGVVSSTTLMANGSQFEQAVALAKSNSQLAVGCHVVFVDGTPISNPELVPSLLASPGSTTFNHSVQNVLLRALRGQLRSDEMTLEAAAQIHKLQMAGVTVSHVDTHKHAHVHPNILVPLLRAARECGVRAIRNPVETIPLHRVALRPNLWKRWLEVTLTRTLTRQFRDHVTEAGLMTPDGTVGIIATGVLDQTIFSSLIENLPEGTWEFVCHPGYNDSELRSVRTRLRGSREMELRTLTCSATRELLRSHGIELISYRDLVAGQPSSVFTPTSAGHQPS